MALALLLSNYVQTSTGDVGFRSICFWYQMLKAIQTSGFRVDSILGDFVISPAQATDDPSEIGEVDIVLLAVKAWQVREAAKAIRSLIG